MHLHIDGLVQNSSNSIANALELLQSCTKSCTKPSILCHIFPSIVNINAVYNLAMQKVGHQKI